MAWCTLKDETRPTFVCRPGRVILKRKFELRKWKGGEIFSVYFHGKVLFGNTAVLDETDMIDCY